MTRLSLILIAQLFILPLVHAQQVNDFPTPDDPLHKRVAMYDALMRGNHINENLFMQHVIFPPVGTEAPMVGSQEDCIEVTGAMLAAYCYRYAVTKDPAHRQQCHDIIAGIAKLEKVTGVSGVFARSLNKTDKPLWHERNHFFPIEWHESTTMPGYRWEGDLSSDKFVDLCYMLGLYHDMAADEEHKAIVAGILDRFVGRVVDYNFKLVDVDNKMTLWGNFSPDIPHQPLNALEMLAALKTTHRITGKERYRAAYHRLIDEHGYADELACKSYFQLFPYETDPSLLNKYTMAINRHQYTWAQLEYKHHGEIWFPMVYAALTGDRSVVTPAVLEALQNMEGFQRVTSTFPVLQPDGSTVRVESEHENNAAEMIRNYWFARYYGFIDETW